MTHYALLCSVWYAPGVLITQTLASLCGKK